MRSTSCPSVVSVIQEVCFMTCVGLRELQRRETSYKKEKTDSFAFVTARCVSALIAENANDAVVVGCKFLVAYRLVALVALETFLVPFSAFVFELLHPCTHQTPHICAPTVSSVSLMALH